MEREQKRQMHCLRVAQLMRQIVQDNYNKTDIDPESAYFVGLLHDVGYEFTGVERQEKHAHIGAHLLNENGFTHWKEIMYHGYPQDEYYSDLLLLLNYADMVIDSSGNCVTYEERIQDVESRYGTESPQYKETVEMVDWIKKHVGGLS